MTSTEPERLEAAITAAVTELGRAKVQVAKSIKEQRDLQEVIARIRHQLAEPPPDPSRHRPAFLERMAELRRLTLPRLEEEIVTLSKSYDDLEKASSELIPGIRMLEAAVAELRRSKHLTLMECQIIRVERAILELTEASDRLGTHEANQDKAALLDRAEKLASTLTAVINQLHQE